MEAISALHRGNKIEAIKHVRAEQGLDLKDAKDLVEAYLKENPAVQANFTAAQGQSGGSGLLWLVVIVAAALRSRTCCSAGRRDDPWPSTSACFAP